MDRAALEVKTLLRIVLVLVVILLTIEILQSLLGPLFRLLQMALGAVVIILIVLWLLDRI